MSEEWRGHTEPAPEGSSHPDFVAIYHGNPIILSPSPSGGGYEMDCPRCTRNAWLYPHPTEGHAVYQDLRGGVTVQPSIVCGCGLHIVIENGEARDV